jgi:hypothetical protein
MFRSLGFSAILGIALTGAAWAQTAGSVSGVVEDAQGLPVPGATVRLLQAVSGLERRTVSGGDGRFSLPNVPLDRYTLSVELEGFAPLARAIVIDSNVPMDLRLTLDLAGTATTVTVTPDEVLVDKASAGTRHQISMKGLEQLPSAVGSRGIESALVTFPGFAQNANGAIHPRGAHNQMTYVVDGLAISDQLTGAFANALDAGVVQRVELVTGNVPAEFGAKVSGVALITSRSGLGTGQRLTGNASLAGGGFGTIQASVQAGGERRGIGYFGSMTSMRTDRFLDQVSLDNLHNAGSFTRGFVRVDRQFQGGTLLRLQGMGGRSGFEVANLRSQQASGQDQRQGLADGAAWVSVLRSLDSVSSIEATGGYRYTTAELTPSAGDTPVTARQDRSLATMTGAVRYSRLVRGSTWRAGADFQRFPVRESFDMAITSADFNVPGSPRFNAALTPHDLTRGGTPFRFSDARSGTNVSAFAQATMPWRRVTASVGARVDRYSMLVRAHAVQPRLGVSYELPDSQGVVRLSYNYNLQTPPNENLLLSSSPEAAALAPDSVKEALGATVQPIRPERQHVLEGGYQRALGDTSVLDVVAYIKRSTDQQDNNNFFDTGIIFPTSLKAIRAEGFEVRLSMPTYRGLSGTVSATMARAVSTPPFTGGLFLGQDAVDLLSAGPFRIDHDQRASLHGTVQYTGPHGVWLGGSVRYDSGLVSNPSDPVEVAADPDFHDLLPYVNLTADVPRVRPRTIADLAVGWDGRRAGKRTWSTQVQVTNLTNRTALYNFQSVFVGTRLVQPRTVSARVTRHF